MKYRVKISYVVIVEGKTDAEAAYQACYKAAYDDSVRHLDVRVVSKAADDPQPAVTTAPHQHTDLTVQDDAPVAGVSGVNEGVSVDTEPASSKHDVGLVGFEPKNEGSV